MVNINNPPNRKRFNDAATLSEPRPNKDTYKLLITALPVIIHCLPQPESTPHSMEKRKKSVYLSEIEFSGLKPAKTSKTRLKKCFY